MADSRFCECGADIDGNDPHMPECWIRHAEEHEAQRVENLRKPSEEEFCAILLALGAKCRQGNLNNEEVANILDNTDVVAILVMPGGHTDSTKFAWCMSDYERESFVMFDRGEGWEFSTHPPYIEAD